MLFYAAGPFVPYIDERGAEHDYWRDYLIMKVKNHSFIDPRKNNQSCPATFTREDLEGVIKSDGVFLYRPANGEIIGGAWEHGIACGINEVSKRKIPTIYVDERFLPFPPVMASAKRTFANLDAAIVYMKFLDSWQDEMKAICAYLDWEEKYFRRLKGEKGG